jgi:hypothetical protein
LQSQRKAYCYYCESSICKYLQADIIDSASKDTDGDVLRRGVAKVFANGAATPGRRVQEAENGKKMNILK